eukprot:2115118-Alexandrium_andersonii.AAC.1
MHDDAALSAFRNMYSLFGAVRRFQPQGEHSPKRLKAPRLASNNIQLHDPALCSLRQDYPCLGALRTRVAVRKVPPDLVRAAPKGQQIRDNSRLTWL